MSSGCTSGNAIDALSYCSACSGADSGGSPRYGGWRVMYIASGAGGATYLTITQASAPSNTGPYPGTFLTFKEVLPPNCGGSTCVGQLDTGQFAVNDSCTSCSLANVTLAGTDNAVCFVDTINQVYNFTSPYRIDALGDLLGIDITSGTGPTFNIDGGATGFMMACIYFKNAGGSYTPPTPLFSDVTTANNVAGFASVWQNQTGQNCSPTCTYTLNAAISNSGDLLFLDAGPVAAPAQLISSVTGGCSGSWVVPSGANTFQNTTVNNISGAYCLSSTAAATALSITLASNATSIQFAFHEIHRSSGSWALDTQNSSKNASGGTILPGQSLTLSGTNDVCFGHVTWTAATSYGAGNSLNPLPSGISMFDFNGGPDGGYHSEIINTPSGAAAEYLISPNSTTASASAKICFK